jgi:hypothetical protein
LRQAFTGTIEVWGKTLHLWYELIRQSRRGSVVVADRLNATRDRDHARLLRSCVCFSLYSKMKCVPTRGSSSTRTQRRSHLAIGAKRVARRGTAASPERANIDSPSELAKRIDELRDEEVSDIARVRSDTDTHAPSRPSSRAALLTAFGSFFGSHGGVLGYFVCAPDSTSADRCGGAPDGGAEEETARSSISARA